MQLPDDLICGNGSRTQQQLMLASIVLNVVFFFLFAFDLKSGPSCPSTPCSQIQSPSPVDACLLRNTQLSLIQDSGSISSSIAPKPLETNETINLDHGDPTMFEAYWLGNGDSSTTVILGWQQMSYFASRKHFIWFVEQDLDSQIRKLHSVVGNAVTEGKLIVVGTGSTQLFQAALYAVSPRDGTSPASVVSATPYYSSYPVLTDYLKSGIHKWAGDAAEYEAADNSPYIELVTSPNNPDGTIRPSIVNGSGPVIYDLAYYWPHYTPITEAADHDIMLFTVSKSTGHAGTRIGWAVIKDPKVAKDMAKFIELNTIGVSHDSQLRAAQIFKSIVRGYTSTSADSRPFKLTRTEHSISDRDHYMKQNQLFHFGFLEMNRRWDLLRKAVAVSDRFSLPEFPSTFCSFFGQVASSHPAFAWLKCNREADCKEVLKLEGSVLSRSGIQFGVGPEYVRISMLDREHNFEAFIARISAMASASQPEEHKML